MNDLIFDLLDGAIEFAQGIFDINKKKKMEKEAEHLLDPAFLLEEENRFIRGEEVDAATLYRIGSCHYNGTMPGKPADKKQAARYFSLAAERNNAWGQYSLAMMMINGEGGEIYHDGAPRLLMDASGNGNVPAMLELGNLLCSGRWITDFAMAADYYEFAAENGSLEAQKKAAALYANEEAVKDFDKMAYWLREAYKNGYKEAGKLLPELEAAGYGRIGALAFDYYEGRNGREKDLVKAAYWMKKTARAGNTRAEYTYGHMIEFGEGGLYPSKEEAIRWYTRAAEDWDGDAKKALRRLKKDE